MLAGAGCISLPARVAEELRAPEAGRVDHYDGERAAANACEGESCGRS